MRAVSGLCIPLYGGASCSAQSTLGANGQVLTVQLLSDQFAFDRLLSPKADIQEPRITLKLGSAFGHKRTFSPILCRRFPYLPPATTVYSSLYLPLYMIGLAKRVVWTKTFTDNNLTHDYFPVFYKKLDNEGFLCT